MRATATVPHSKKQINRAGKLWAKLLRAYQDDGDAALERFDTDQVLRADELIEWWRTQHARSLATVNANLRYYIAELPDKGSVTQRLKRRATIIDKLCREPTMALTTMEDIGGCRVITKDQAQAYRLRSRLKKNWDIHRDRDYVGQGGGNGARLLRGSL